MDAKNIADSFQYSHLAAAATTTVKTGPGILHSISLNTLAVTSTVTIYDNTAGSGTVIGIISSTVNQGPYIYDVLFNTGLTIVITGAPDITVSYK